MDKIEEAQEILKKFDLPVKQQSKICALTLLALCNVKPSNAWQMAERKSMTLSKDIMNFVNEFYEAGYMPNTRESFRKAALNPFVEYNIAELNPDNPNLVPTSSKTHYAISPLILNTLKKYGTSEWDIALENFLRYKNQAPVKDKTEFSLKRLHINSYKSIVDDTIELGRFNVFIGANGCGKTNILEALATVGADIANDLNFDGIYSRGVRIARPDLMLSSFLGNNQNSSINVELNFQRNEVKEKYQCSLTPVTLNDIYSKWVNLAEEENIPIIIDNYLKEIVSESPNLTAEEISKKFKNLLSERGLKRERKFDSLLKDFAIFDVNTKSLRGISSADSKKTPLGLNGEGLDLLIASFDKHQRASLDSCLSFFDWLSEVVADRDDKYKLAGLKPGRSISTLYFRDKFMDKTNNTFSAENSNEGILHVLFYLALFISDKTPNLFGVDNIETALNPRLCQVLVSDLVKLSKDYGKQVLITTHNPAILDGLNLLDDEQRLFEVYRDSNGYTKTRRIKFKKDLSDKNFKLSEMWLNGLLGALPQNF